MKTAIYSIVAAASFVAAQNFDGQPECAVQCLRDAIPQVGCSMGDTACQCDPDVQAALGGVIAPCLVEACNPDDLGAAQNAGGAACAAFSASASGSATEGGVTIQTSMPTEDGFTIQTSTPTELVSTTVVSTTTVVSSEATSDASSSEVESTTTTTATTSTRITTTSSTSTESTTTDAPESTETESPTQTSDDSATSISTDADGAAGAGPTIGALAAIIAMAVAL